MTDDTNEKLDIRCLVCLTQRYEFLFQLSAVITVLILDDNKTGGLFFMLGESFQFLGNGTFQIRFSLMWTDEIILTQHPRCR